MEMRIMRRRPFSITLLTAKSFDRGNRTAINKSMILIFCIALISLTMMNANNPADAQTYIASPAFQALYNQVEQMYFAPKGTSVPQMARRYPAEVFRVFGHALRQQMLHIKNNPANQQQYVDLVNETRAYLSQLTHRPSHWPVAQRAINGDYDNDIWNVYGIQTGTAPSVLAGQTGPGMDDGIDHMPFQRDSVTDPNQVDLLGNKPSNNFEAAKAVFNQGVDLWNAGTRIWNTGDKETAYSYYNMAGQKFQRACELGLVDGCRPGAQSGEIMTKWE